jgi:hypothetical protein
MLSDNIQRRRCASTSDATAAPITQLRSFQLYDMQAIHKHRQARRHHTNSSDSTNSATINNLFIP